MRSLYIQQAPKERPANSSIVTPRRMFSNFFPTSGPDGPNDRWARAMIFSAAVLSGMLAAPLIGRAEDKPKGKQVAAAQIAQTQETTPKLECKITPDKIQEAEKEAAGKRYRRLDNPDLAKKGDLEACFGDCIFANLPNSEYGFIAFNVQIHEGKRFLVVGINEYNGKGLQTLAAEDLEPTAQEYEKTFGKKVGGFRLVAKEGIDPKSGWFIQARAIPVSERGVQPEFNGLPVPYKLAGYPHPEGGAYSSEGFICKEKSVELGMLTPK